MHYYHQYIQQNCKQKKILSLYKHTYKFEEQKKTFFSLDTKKLKQQNKFDFKIRIKKID